MLFVALVSSGDAEPGMLPPGLQAVGGITLVERQVRQALRAGAAQVLLLAAALPEPVENRLVADGRVVRVATVRDLGRQLTDKTAPLLLMAPGTLLDDRLIRQMASGTSAPALMVFSGESPVGAERLDARDHWAGLALLPAAMVRQVAAGLGEWELGATLVRAAVEAGATRLDTSTFDTYAADRRRNLPFVWARPTEPASCDSATGLLQDAAQKGCLDWPARFIHAPLEDWLVRLLLPTSVTPNRITLLTAILGFGAIAAFAAGWLWVGLVLMLIIGPLDGVDGKLARTRCEFSRWGDLEHVLDKVVEYGAYIAMGYWFAKFHGVAAWLAAAGIIIFALSEALKGEFFRRFTKRQLDDWGPFERRFRLVGGRRNTFFWTLIPFAAYGLWFEGFLFILGYAALTFAVAEWRFLKALFEHARQTNQQVAANFAETAYDFMPKAKPLVRDKIMT
ncbi:MAG: CDP-alcohol phosphatidyltransferase family protein [Sphingomonadaceae bacterium]